MALLRYGCLTCFTFDGVGHQPAGLQWQDPEEADARSLLDADVQRQVEDRLSGSEPQAELVVTQAPREELLVGQGEGHLRPRWHAHRHAELLYLPFPLMVTQETAKQSHWMTPQTVCGAITII